MLDLYCDRNDSLGIGGDEPCPEAGEERECPKEEKCSRTDVLNHGWGHETNDKVIDPVGAGGKGDAFGSV